MITNVSLSFEHLPSAVLKKILQNDLLNMDNPILSDEAILHICDILVSRNPTDANELQLYNEEEIK